MDCKTEPQYTEVRLYSAVMQKCIPIAILARRIDFLCHSDFLMIQLSIVFLTLAVC